MGILDRRKLIGALGSAAAGWIIPHGGDCCGCAVSEECGSNEYRIRL
jgi:hypothetical protein